MIYHNASSGNTFNDPWTLVISGGSTGAIGSFLDVQLNMAPLVNTNIVNMAITSSSPGLTINGAGDVWSVQASSPGTYTFNVTGELTIGVTGGSYNVGLTETVAPVPIPPAALLFGSALIGLAGLRRKKETVPEAA